MSGEVRIDYLHRLSYEQAERLQGSGHISQDEWDWVCWAIAQTTSTIAQDLVGKPCPVHGELYPCCVKDKTNATGRPVAQQDQ